jgi:hypothetical protein
MKQYARDKLLQDAIETAAHLLEKREEFFPFAVVMSNENEIRHIQAMMGEERPASEAVIDSIIQTIKAEGPQKSYRCVAIVSDVKLADTANGSKTDAMRVQMDDSEAGSVTCYLPYTLHQNTIELGELIASYSEEVKFFS